MAGDDISGVETEEQRREKLMADFLAGLGQPRRKKVRVRSGPKTPPGPAVPFDEAERQARAAKAEATRLDGGKSFGAHDQVRIVGPNIGDDVAH